MTHEFGHELGLNHDGYQPHNCPIYPSLMSYTYQDKLNGRAELKQLSSGALGSILLDERRLSERLPVPIERVRFLANDPYFYQLRPAGGSTLVDWNWNGVFGEEGVVADINYSHFTDIGRRRYELGASDGPALATVGDGPAERLLLFSSSVRGNSPRPAPDAPAAAANLGPERPGALVVQAWQGEDRDRDGKRWSTETVVEADGVIGDPTAVSGGSAVWVAYPTAAGVRLRPVALGRQVDATPRVGAPVPVEQSNGADPSLCALGDGLALFLWRGPGRPVGVRRLAPTATGLEMGPELELPIDSVVPVAAVAGPKRWLHPDGLGRVNRRTRPTSSPGGNSPLRLRGRRPRRGFSRSGRTWSTAPSPVPFGPPLRAPNTGSRRGESTFSRADVTGLRTVSRPLIPRGPNRRSRSTCATAPETAGSIAGITRPASSTAARPPASAGFATTSSTPTAGIPLAPTATIASSSASPLPAPLTR